MASIQSKPSAFCKKRMALALAVAAFASTSANAQDASNTYADLSQLEQAAKAEGTLNIYTAKDYDFLISGFKAAYPWATVNYTALDPSSTATKLQVELGAGANNADIANLKVAQVQQFIALEALAKVVVPNDAQVPDELKDPDAFTHPETSSYIALVYNTDLVKDPPTKLTDLADPKWKDMLAIDIVAGSAGSQVLGVPRASMGDDAWKKFLQDLAANEPSITKTNSVSFDQVLRGDSAVCPCAYHDFTARKPGSPLGAVLYDQDGDGIATALSVAVVLKKAPHPAMAALWLNWMEAADGGQPAFAKSGRIPVVNFPGNDVGLPAGTKVAPLWKVLGGYFKDPDSYDSVIEAALVQH